MKYKIKNTASVGKSYIGGNGRKVNFEPGEQKKLSTLPPEVEDGDYEKAKGWVIERIESKPEDIEHKEDD